MPARPICLLHGCRFVVVGALVCWGSIVSAQTEATQDASTANPIARGGAAAADFDTLIDLIQSTVAADSWQDNGTGEGTISPFGLNGVYVNARGMLRMAQADDMQAVDALAAGQPRDAANASDVAEEEIAAARQGSVLRFVSLPRLEAAIAQRQQQSLPLDEAMLTLAGLQRVKYILVYPETGDLVVAGPAGDWHSDGAGRLMSVDAARPIVRLDDLLVLWRRQRDEQSRPFGCSINPRQAGLAAAQQYLAESSRTPVAPKMRRSWLQGLRDQVGEQDVQFFHIDPTTRIAGILLAADYHMKLIGMGLAEGTPGVSSYLSTVRLDNNGNPPPMAVLRWWFSLSEMKVAASPDRRAFVLPDQPVQVQSENELLAAQGRRVHTGKSEELNSRFAESFTGEYDALSDKYPIYAELHRVFELTLVLSLIESEGLLDAAGWYPTLLLDAKRLRLPTARVLRSVETVINHRVLARRHIVAGVSGGVWVDSRGKVQVAPVSKDVRDLHARGNRVAESQTDEARIQGPDGLPKQASPTDRVR